MGLKLQDVPASQGGRWVQQGLREAWRHPMGYASLFVIFLPLAELLSLLPVVGAPLWMMGVPLISLAYMMATLGSLREHPPRLGVYLVPWRLPLARRRALLALCASYALCCSLGLLLCDLIDDGRFAELVIKLQTAQTQGDSATVAQLAAGSGLMMGSLTRMAVFALLSMPFWHAPALVVWGQQGVAQALFSSTLAVWRARGAFLVYSLAWMGVSFACAVLISLVMLLAGGGAMVVMVLIPISLLLTCGFYVSLFFTFKDSFGLPETTATAAATETTPPPEA